MDHQFYIDCYVITNVGKVREKNEDNFYFFHYILEEQKEFFKRQLASTSQPLLFGVFDGMGGLSYGEEASFMCADICNHYELHEQFLKDDMIAICHIANAQVNMRKRELRADIGSTASMLTFFQDNVFLCNIGDSPILRLHDHRLQSIFKEHTEKELYEKLYGVNHHKTKFRLTQNIGVSQEDVRIQPHADQMKLHDGDIYLICSDGLTDMVSLEDIKNELNHFDEQTIHQLLQMALNNGGKDNTTIILIKVSREDL